MRVAGLLFLWFINLSALLYIFSYLVARLPLIIIVLPLCLAAGVAIIYFIFKILQKVWIYLDGKNDRQD